MTIYFNSRCRENVCDGSEGRLMLGKLCTYVSIDVRSENGNHS